MNRVHFRSESSEWGTPQAFFDKCNARFGPFTLDACATAANAKCGAFYCKAENGLSKRWFGRVWMNPPYGREIGKWMAKAYREGRRDVLVVCLVPARTDTAWWHDYAMKGKVEFIRGRLTFDGGLFTAPFPSALVVFGSLPPSSGRV